ncbi:putative Prolamin-like domain-containing protein [Rosa chinensis]|uniref:Putative Prolamin-like domain-containing protein n=1 Tax=Rosa chinensis TaxID=74649 RepID=A0A2P6P6W1_ROSCH|nr:putative Prolamin-like domain-containing protein [Rosa chinensis]
MASSSKLFLLIALLAKTMPFMASFGPLMNNPRIGSYPRNLATRLNLVGESSNCWDSLLQLHACSGEVILFFFNGETYLGHTCCEAIRMIEHQCWPALLGTLGFTTQETDVLKGYCDKADQIHSPPSPPSPATLI